MQRWSEEIDQILGGDHVVMLVYATPASGSVLLPLNNFAGRDRTKGRLSAINSSVGAWRKLDRIRQDPRIALAYHTRLHSETRRPEYVLVQGRAILSPPVPDYPTVIREQWERFESWTSTPSWWKRWQRVYAWRVPIDVEVHRIIAWPDLGCRGTPVVYGAPLPECSPQPQQAPSKGTAPRFNAERAAARAVRLPHVLLGWVGADGYPLAVPVQILSGNRSGISLRAANGLVPPGNRRAGLTAHWFSAGVIGQNQRKHTGWLMKATDSQDLLYAPHTQSNYRFPTSRTLYRIASGGNSRLNLRGARRAGFVP
jgi:hypothetical protein